MDKTLPYRPSVFDRAYHWMGARPARRWWYLAVYLVTVGVLSVASIIDGRLPGEGGIAYVAVNGLWAVVVYGAIDWIDVEVVRASDRFREVYEGTEDGYRDEVFRLTTMPARTAAAVWGISFALFLVLGATSPDVSDSEALAARLVAAPVFAFSYASGPLLIYHTARLLSGISRLLRSGRVNVFHLTPLYGFSRVTARVGFVYLLVSVFNAVSETVLDIGGGVSAELVLGVAITSVGALASFVLPLLGTHARILNARTAAISENSDHLEHLRSRMYAALEAENHEAFKGLDDALDGLLRMGETLKGIPTWPWTAGTFRGFFTAIGVPILIFVIQRVLDQLL